jgi:hypothetical protein
MSAIDFEESLNALKEMHLKAKKRSPPAKMIDNQPSHVALA